MTFTNCQNVEFLEGNPCSFVLMPGESLSKSVLRQKEPGPSKYNLRVHCKGAWTGEEDTKEIVFFFHHFSLADCFLACHRVEASTSRFWVLFWRRFFFFNLGFSALNCWFWGPGACDSWKMTSHCYLGATPNSRAQKNHRGPKSPTHQFTII